jgi:adenylate cyclase
MSRVRRLLHAWEAPLALSVALAMLIGLLATSESGLPFRLESLTLDARFRLRPVEPPSSQVVIVDIDDKSIAEIGRWPWSRALFAQLLDVSAAGGAKVVVLDLLFTESQPSPLATQRPAIEAAMAPLLEKLGSEERSQFDLALSNLARANDPDAALAEAIGRVGAVIVPFAVDLGPNSDASNLPAAPAVLEKAAYGRVRGADPDRLPEATGLRLPIAPLALSGALAHVTTAPDAAGAYHFDYPVLRYRESYFPSLSLEAVRSFLGISRTNVVVDLGRGIELGPLLVPTDAGMRLLVNYHPDGSIRRISFADVLSGRVAPEIFEGKIVLVGVTATGIGDVFPSPFSPSMSGVERHASLIANMLNSDFLQRDDRTLALDGFMIILCGLSIGVLSRWGAVAASVAAAAMLSVLAQVDYIAFVRFGLWLNFLFPAATIVLTFAIILAVKYAIELRRVRWIRQAFSRYLHPDVVDELCRSGASLRLGGEERELTVLFLDVREFSAIAERLTAPQLVALMNEFFTAMTEVVLAHRGMLDKYIGDSLLAVFGAPLPDRHHALRACRAAIDMRATLSALHGRWRAGGQPCLEMRIGISTGRMVIGNMGSERRFDYTVMGDEVNVASRLETANNVFGTDILVSAATMEAANGHLTFSPRGQIAVKGRQQPVRVFELLPPTHPLVEGATSER